MSKSKKCFNEIAKVINTYELTQTTLNAEEGMTWGEWIYSEYNTLNIYSDD